MSDVPKTFEEWDTNVRPGLPRYRDAGRSDRRSAWHAGRVALMAELLGGVEDATDNPEEVARWCSEVGGEWKVSNAFLRSVVAKFAALDRSRASEAALRKRLAEVEGERDSALAAIDGNTEDLTEYAREQDEVAGSLCALFTALGLEPHLAMEGSGPGDAIRQATRRSEEQRAQLIALREELDEVKRSWSVARREYVLTNQRLRDERSAERRANERLRKPIDVDALANVIENSRLIGSQYDAERLAERIVEWMEASRG